jgi:CheY-like chemotaxis protein
MPRRLFGGPGMKILVVDDQPDCADSLGSMLRTYGHDVEVAYAPVEALKMALNRPPDIAFLDIGMPGMDGWQLAHVLRTGTTRSYLVAVTGFSTPSDYARSKEAGLDMHLVKPIDAAKVEILLAQVERMFAASRGGAPALA